MSKTGAGGAPGFWQSTLKTLQAELRCDIEGLDDTEAARRRLVHGPNVLRPRRERAIALQW